MLGNWSDSPERVNFRLPAPAPRGSTLVAVGRGVPQTGACRSHPFQLVVKCRKAEALCGIVGEAGGVDPFSG